MILITLILTLATLLTASLADITPAAQVKDNIQGTAYVAPITSGKGPIIGSVQVLARPNEGAQVDITLNNFRLEDALEYSYHIHLTPVPADGNCDATGMHFDNRGIEDSVVCDKAKPELCQLGDLSGKHGAIVLSATTGTGVNLHYVDPYLSTTPGHEAFIGERSIVVHNKATKARLNCGNFKLLGTQ